MKKELINELWQRFEAASGTIDGVECWSARDLQAIFGYADWRNFLNALEKAREACGNAGESVDDHFVGITKMVDLGSGAQRPIDDFALTRYACYLIAQNGDPGKAEIAFAQTYFAVQTRKQEVIELRLQEADRIVAREKLKQTERKLSGLIFERGVDERSFGNIRHEGDRALFGGHGTNAMKQRLGVPENRPLADFLPTLTIKAKDFAAELTSHNVQEKDLKGDRAITREHIDNNWEVRSMLIKRGVKPEELPAAEDVEKVRRRLASEQKQVLKGTKKLKPKK
ncbi:MAG: DNA damage-inducible protein D [Flavobacteriales bacterium]|nr:MAG: DNA damage-inducible protein D [Flavobacteriales bacterium]